MVSEAWCIGSSVWEEDGAKKPLNSGAGRPFREGEPRILIWSLNDQ